MCLKLSQKSKPLTAEVPRAYKPGEVAHQQESLRAPRSRVPGPGKRCQEALCVKFTARSGTSSGGRGSGWGLCQAPSPPGPLVGTAPRSWTPASRWLMREARTYNCRL